MRAQVCEKDKLEKNSVKLASLKRLGLSLTIKGFKLHGREREGGRGTQRPLMDRLKHSFFSVLNQFVVF